MEERILESKSQSLRFQFLCTEQTTLCVVINEHRHQQDSSVCDTWVFLIYNQGAFVKYAHIFKAVLSYASYNCYEALFITLLELLGFVKRKTNITVCETLNPKGLVLILSLALKSFMIAFCFIKVFRCSSSEGMSVGGTGYQAG